MKESASPKGEAGPVLAGTVTRRAFWGVCGGSCRGAIDSATQRISRAWQSSSQIMYEIQDTTSLRETIYDCDVLRDGQLRGCGAPSGEQMTTSSKCFLTAVLCAASWCCSRPQKVAEQPGRLIAGTYNSGFGLAHDTYNGMGAASDGKIYYVLSAEPYDVAGQMYSFDPGTKKIRHLGDLTEACGEKGMKAIAQGKSHVRSIESNGKLYFATHVGYYSTIDGMEKMGIPPAGYRPYPGGHLLTYDIASGKFESLAVALRGEGILTMNLDAARGRIYFLTWPTGTFYRFDLAKSELKELGSFFEHGETGTGPTYRTICRSIGIDPRDGAVYFTTGDGAIHRYRYDRDAVETIAGDNMNKDYFGVYDPTSPGHMAYNWRQIVWNPSDNKFYGVHGNSGYLFRFDPAAERVEVLQRITSEPSQRSGMYDEFSYGYLGFTLGPDGRTLYII